MIVGRGAERRGDLARHALGDAQALGVDVHQRDVRVLQRREAQQVAEQVLREHDAAGADEGDLGHRRVVRRAARRRQGLR